VKRSPAPGNGFFTAARKEAPTAQVIPEGSEIDFEIREMIDSPGRPANRLLQN
jgi:hypothetical protein